MRTYDRDTFVRARAAWEEGEFGSAWSELRRLAWERGFPFPPAGTKWDDRDDPEPSQRAIIHRALVDRPRDTIATVARSRSWGQVVAGILQTEDRLREDADLVDREAEYDRTERPTYREAVMSIAGILERIEASR